jgi:hypothetical protein
VNTQESDMSTTTFITTHAIGNDHVGEMGREHRRFADFVTANAPRLLDFQAYVNEEKTAVKLAFVFPDVASDHDHLTDGAARSLRDSGWAALGAAASILVLLFTAVSVAFGASATPA